MKPRNGLPRRGSRQSIRGPSWPRSRGRRDGSGAGGGERGKCPAGRPRDGSAGGGPPLAATAAAAPRPPQARRRGSAPSGLVATRAVGLQRARSGRGRTGFSAAGAGAGVGWGAKGPGSAQAPNRWLVSKSLSIGVEKPGKLGVKSASLRSRTRGPTAQMQR